MCDPVTIAIMTGAQLLAQEQQLKAMKAQGKMQKQMLDREQYVKNVQYQEAENNRRQQFLQENASNEARASAMGITGQGNSYKALAKKNYDFFKGDIGALRFDAVNMRQDIRDQQKLIDMNIKAAQKTTRMNQLATLGMGMYQFNAAKPPTPDSLSTLQMPGNQTSAGYTMGGMNPSLSVGPLGSPQPLTDRFKSTLFGYGR